jgi:hypothetical protein
MLDETEFWLSSGRVRIEEIVVSGLGEGAKQFGMHWCSLWKERKKGGGKGTTDEGVAICDGDSVAQSQDGCAVGAARQLDAGQPSRA